MILQYKIPLIQDFHCIYLPSIFLFHLKNKVNLPKIRTKKTFPKVPEPKVFNILKLWKFTISLSSSPLSSTESSDMPSLSTSKVPLRGAPSLLCSSMLLIGGLMAISALFFAVIDFLVSSTLSSSWISFFREIFIKK